MDPAWTTPLIPRQVLFGNPDRTSARISPDGLHVSFLAPRDGVLNVWIAPVDDITKAQPLTNDKGRGIHEYYWAYTNRHVLYLQDQNGDENWRIHCVDLDTGKTRDLTPFDGVQARLQELSHRHPDEILVAINHRQPALHDLYRINLRNGDRTLVVENPGFIGFETQHFELRLAQVMTPAGELQLLRPAGDDWDLFAEIPAADTLTTGPAGCNETGTHVYLLDSRDRNTSALYLVELATGERTQLAQSPRADLSEVELAPVTRTLQAVAVTTERKEWIVFDPVVEPDFILLRTLARGDFAIVARTLDDRRWIVAYDVDNGPRAYYLYNRDTRAARHLFDSRDDLRAAPLAELQALTIPARDGLPLVSYLTLPRDTHGPRPTCPLPLVLLVHGGPWHRDTWGFVPEHQWLANRGYAVLSVNFRGSTGFGKDFLNAANREWGGRMHTDLLDAVTWAVAQGIADPDRVAIFGGSYGGYATLWALTQSPEIFCCGVDLVGPSSLITLLESIPPYWAPMIEVFTTRVGDHRTEDGRRFLTERSPLTYAERMRRPLLIGQGANDPRVKQAESDQLVTALQSRSIPVTYVLYPDEGHGFARPSNSLSFSAIAEAFLAAHLGGRCEPFGTDFRGASLEVPAGADQIPGLAAALASH
ncbi:MAG: S9 family peptidase [Phycisphaerales bacterium]|nr:S9 family peptidase [Phycisphaerales bacterium]